MAMNPRLLRPKATASVAPPSGTSAAILLRFDGENGSTTFIDSSPSAIAITAGGSAEISTAQSKYGGSSGLFGLSSYVYGNVTFDWSADWTLELWFRREGVGSGAAYTLFEAGNIQGGAGGVHLQLTASGDEVRIDDATSVGIVGATAPLSEWIHIAVVRDSGTNYLFIDGVLQGSAAFTFPVASTRFTVGAAPNYSFYLNGYIDDLRLAPIAVYDVTQCFDPPSAALPATGIEPVEGIPCPAPPATVPAAITDLTATAGDELVDLAWTAPSDGGDAITDYIIEVSSDGGSTWTEYSDGPGTFTTSAIGMLTNGTQYYFRVAAVNSVGTGDWSNTPDATPAAPLTAPSPPESATASGGDGSVSLSWSYPSDAGGSEITGFEVEVSTDGITFYYLTGPTLDLSYTDSAVTNGTTYYYRVKASNAIGDSDWANFDGGTGVTPHRLGCMDSMAINYDPAATQDDGSCTYPVYGCTDTSANNYDPSANTDDGSCTYPTYGCTDPGATNYDSTATADDGSCTY